MFYLNAKQKEGGWIKMSKFYGLNQKMLEFKSWGCGYFVVGTVSIMCFLMILPDSLLEKS